MPRRATLSTSEGETVGGSAGTAGMSGRVRR